LDGRLRPSLAEIAAARDRLDGRVLRTPLRRSDWLSDVAGTPVWLKLESVQMTGSFKIRGALNAAILHAERHPGLPRPLVTASAGNHGRALALAAEQIAVPLTVFVPRDAPETKRRAIERHGARLVLERDYDAAEASAREFARREDAAFISPYNDPDVIAGAGTVALEVLDDLPEARCFVVPVGGAGLASGIGIVVKAQAPAARMIGVEAAASAAFSTSLRAGRITAIEPRPTLADGLAGNIEERSITFDLMRQVCNGMALAEEKLLEAAIAGLAREEHLVAEGAGAAAAAALLGRRIDERKGPIVAIVSGSNIDLDRFSGILAAGMRERSG
jgi:threonine dehydratase